MAGSTIAVDSEILASAQTEELPLITPRWTAMAFVLAAFLLMSMGGAIIAAPLTLPLMYVGVRRHPTHLFRVIGGLLSALTVGEVAWAAVYVSLGESKPWIWVLPLTGVLAAVLAYACFHGTATPSSGDATSHPLQALDLDSRPSVFDLQGQRAVTPRRQAPAGQSKARGR